jgi:hypothetical protein
LFDVMVPGTKIQSCIHLVCLGVSISKIFLRDY